MLNHTQGVDSFSIPIKISGKMLSGSDADTKSMHLWSSVKFIAI